MTMMEMIMCSRTVKLRQTRKEILFLMLLFHFISTTLCSYNCIKHCACDMRGDLLIADCTIGNFTEVPEPEPGQKINILYLKLNRITRLRSGDFSLYNNLQELQLQGNRIDTVEENAFDGLENLEKLDLSKNMIGSIPTSAMLKLTTKLKWIALSMNGLRQIPNELSNFTKLSQLDLSNNKFITKIAPDSFPTSLELLDMHYTGIKHFGKLAFKGLKNLRTLLLNDNMASASVKFDNGIFDSLTSLEFLDLSRFYCKKLPRNSFFRLRNLKSLIMNNCWLTEPPIFARYGSWENEKSSYDSLNANRWSDKEKSSSHTSNSTTNTAPQLTTNQITTEPGQGIWYNPQLSFLDLSNNQRMTIKPGEIRFPPSLTELRLECTRVSTIDNNLFNETSAIQKLNICNSRLRTIAKDAFMKFTNVSEICLSGNPLLGAPRLPTTLLTLNLSDTKIKNLTHIILQNLSKVVEADIKNGEIEWLEDFAFANMTSMRILDLSENKIHTLRKNTLYIGSPYTQGNQDIGSGLATLLLSSNLLRNLEAGAFSSHTHLKELDLQHNFLDELLPGMFQNLKGLITLNLNNNLIVDIAPHTFEDLRELEILNIQGNEIEIIYSGTFKEMKNLKKLILANNNLMLFHESTFVSLGYLDISNNNMTSFPKIGGDMLGSIISSYNAFEDVPVDALENAKNLKNLDMSHCRIGSLNYSVFDSTPGLQELAINDNFLSEFADQELPNLETLFIGENEIETIDVNLNNIVPNIIRLDSGYNKITYLNPVIFFGLKSLNNLELSGNNFHCDCNLRPLVLWMKNKSDILTDADSYLCETPEEEYAMPIIDAVLELDCDKPPTTHKAQMYISISIVIGIFTLVVIFLTITICRRAQIRRTRDQNTDQAASENGQMRVASSDGCCSPCKQWCLGVAHFTHERGHRERVTSEEQDLMISSPVTSPSDKEAPTSL